MFIKPSLLLLATLAAVTTATPDDLGEQRSEIFLLDVSASDMEYPNQAYQNLGYNERHESQCTFQIYGTTAKMAAGDEAMLRLSKMFTKQYNRVSKHIRAGKFYKNLDDKKYRPVELHVEGEYNERRQLVVQDMVEDILDRELTYNGEQPESEIGEPEKVKMEVTEVIKQEIGEVSEGRRLAIGFLYNFMRVGYVCRFCYKDNSDRRQLQTDVDPELATEVFIELFIRKMKELENERFQFIQDALERGGDCVKIQCDGGNWYSSMGCATNGL